MTAAIDGEVVSISPSSNHDENVALLMRRATDVAGVCREIVSKTAQAIQGRKYVRLEGWQSIAVAYGCVASSRDVEAVPGGIRAIGEVRRMSDGALVAQAEGFVGDDEKAWASRPLYARRAMAQTRAISRACRSAFAFVVTLIDGDLQTTPFEEVEGLGLGEPKALPPPAGVDKLRQVARATPPAPAANEPPPHSDDDAPPSSEPASPRAPSSHDGSATFAFGKDKGTPISQLDERSLRFYEKCLVRDLADASKQQWHAKSQAQLTNLRAELASRGT